VRSGRQGKCIWQLRMTKLRRFPKGDLSFYRKDVAQSGGLDVPRRNNPVPININTTSALIFSIASRVFSASFISSH
jgi:hypothetical protein